MKNLALVLALSTLFAPLLGIKTDAGKKNEVLLEAKEQKVISATRATKSLINVNETPQEYSLAIFFDYENYSENNYESLRKDGETYRATSKRYHEARNNAMVRKLGISADRVIVSEYAPVAYYTFTNKTYDEILAYANALPYDRGIASIRISSQDTYLTDEEDDLVTADPLSLSNDVPVDSPTTPNPDVRYDNYPSTVTYTGEGITVGLLDSGTMNIYHDNFQDISVTVLNDDNPIDINSSCEYHPSLVGSVIAGKNGIAPYANLLYVDMNGTCRFFGLEDLIDGGADIINMSIGYATKKDGSYSTSIEAYFDYMYVSTRIVMVAATGNSLNLDTGSPYLYQPANCANVIAVGSIDHNGYPSAFSNYSSSSEIKSKPNIVAVGQQRYVAGFTTDIYRTSQYSGTSLSAAAVSGAIALLFEKRGVLEMPAVLSLLNVTANNDFVSKETETINVLGLQDLDYDGVYCYEYTGDAFDVANVANGSSGYYTRSGAGALDITKLLVGQSNFAQPTYSFPSIGYTTLKSMLYVPAGRTLTISAAWERRAACTYYYGTGLNFILGYSESSIPNFNIGLYNGSGTLVASTLFCPSTTEMIRYSVTASNFFTIKLQALSNYSTTTNLNFAYYY